MLRSVVLLVLAAACSLAGAYSPLMPELEPELLDRIAEDVAKIAVAKLGWRTSHARAASRNLRAGAALATSPPASPFRTVGSGDAGCVAGGRGK